MKFLSFQALVVAVVLAACGCSSSAGNAPASEDSRTGAGEEVGSIGMQLTLPAGARIEVVQWSITGPNGASTIVRSGSVNVQNSLVLAFVVGNVPVGSGYVVSVSGSANDGSAICAGSSAFDIAATLTTNVVMPLGCNVATSGAEVTLASGATFDCAAWSDVTANPTVTTVGHSVAVHATATGPIPSALTYAWSATSGSFDTPNAPTANFTCSAAGTSTLTVTVGDGPVPAGASCNHDLSTKTITVTCEAAQVPALPPWGVLMLACSFITLGSLVIRRKGTKKTTFGDF